MQASGFGPLLRGNRLAAGLTQEELAERATVSVRTISSLEHGLSRPQLKTVGLLARALGLTDAQRNEFLRAARPVSDAVLSDAVLSDAVLDVAPATGSGSAAVPHQLPAAPTEFTGRLAELKTLTTLLDSDADGGGPEPRTAMVSAIGGTPGVGKTALALHWAHQVAGRFPDGQLYVNLRGYDHDRPMPAAEALAGFLRALGVPGPDIPLDGAERAAKYRSLLDGRRMLVMLDNAGSVEQARPLLPGSASCLTLITSRDALAGLVARDGAQRITLDLLSPAEADRLLTRLVGDRAATDPRATAELAAACAWLPLALRVAAELASARPAASMADLAAELADRQGRLDLLEADGDPRTAVRAVFSWSYLHLEAETGHMFRLLGLHPGPDLVPYAAAALTGTTVAAARWRLDQLARAHLIRPAGAGRYGQHDLLRTYARELAAATDGDDAGRIALTRLFDHYLHGAAAAMNTLYPARQRRRPRIPVPATPAPRLTDPDAARAWLDDQLATLAAIAAHAADHGWPGHAPRLAATLADYFNMEGHFAEGVTVHTCALRAARGAGDRSAEARSLSGLGSLCLTQGRYQEVAGNLSQALALHRETGDLYGQAIALNNLAICNFKEGRDEQASDQYQQAVTLYRETGDVVHEARTLNNLGCLELRHGRYQLATGHLRRALALSRQVGAPQEGAYALTNLGYASLRQDQVPQAAECFQQALTLSRQAGYVTGEALGLNGLAAVDRKQAHYERAEDRGRQALALYRKSGDQTGEVEALNELGTLSLATGRPGRARTQHATALRLASQSGDRDEQARAQEGLGRAWHALAEPGKARQHWGQALTLYTELGMPEADQMRAQLSALPL